jgi:membrane protein
MNSTDTPNAHDARQVVRHLRMFTWLKRAEIWALVKNTFDAWSDDNVPRLGASLAYYTALSLAPLIVVVLAIAGLAFGPDAVRGQLVWQIQDTVGYDGAKTIQQLIQTAYKPASGIIATVLGLLTLFFGATSVVMELTDALNTIWHVPVDPSQTGIKNVFRLMRQRFVSFAMIVGVGFLLLVSLVVSAWLSAMGRFFNNLLPVSEPILHLVYLIISFTVVTMMFAVIYKVLPAVHLEWSDVAIGAAVTSLLFTLGKLLLGLYLGKSSLASTYGAAGSFVIVLVWVYYSAQIFFLGAEFTRIYTQQLGSQVTGKLKLEDDLQCQLNVERLTSTDPRRPVIIADCIADPAEAARTKVSGRNG